MAKSNGIKDLKQAAKLLNKHAPDGESLAYINPTEARILKAHGGSGIETLAGVPSYSWWETAAEWVGNKAGSIVDWGSELIGNRYGGDEGLKNLGKDAFSVWTGLKAKKDQEGLNQHEMEQFNKLNQQLADAQTQFNVNVAGGPAVTNVPTTIEDVASFTDVTLPTMKTTPLAEGGRIGYNIGGITGEQNAMVMDMLNKGMDHDTISTITGITPEDIQIIINQINEAQSGLEQSGALENLNLKAHGGRIRYGLGSKTGTATADPNRVVTGDPKENLLSYFSNKFAGKEQVQPLEGAQVRSGDDFMANMISQSSQGSQFHLLNEYQNYVTEVGEDNALPFDEWQASRMIAAQGGRIGAKEGGIMPLLNLGGMEKDYRQDGGFVPIGRREKADDVPARLSKNEFVFTADAVRAAGGGDIDQGAQRMYNVMKNLEAGGEISEQSQGQV